MKIQSSLPAAAVQPAQSEARIAERRSVESAASVNLSSEARWVASVSDEARRAPEVRMDVVESTRVQISNGTYEGGIDMDALIERIARDL